MINYFFMLLAIDIGNTYTTFGFFRNDKIVSLFKLNSVPLKSETEYWKHLNQFIKNTKIIRKDIKGVVISSVVPVICSILQKTIKNYLEIKPVIVSSKLKLDIKINYKKPSNLGADRICNVIAAYEKYGGPAIIVDFGTAITYDVVSKRGEFLGGIIAPGIGISSYALNRQTSQLPKIKTIYPKNIIGKDTTACIQSGIMFGTLDAVEGTIKRIKKLIGEDVAVIGTGGYVSLFAKKSKMIEYIEPTLVLEGAHIVYERVMKQNE